MKSHAWLVLATALLSHLPGLRAQEGPIIVVAGTGRVEVEPDYATLHFGVSVRDSTPSAALAGMNARLLSVSSALVDLDLPWDSIPHHRFSLRPEQDRSRPGEPIVGYTASMTVTAEVRDFEQLPRLIERALAAGANIIGGISFGSDRLEGAEDEALRMAVTEAQRKGEVMASALDRELAEIIEVSTPEGTRGFGPTGLLILTHGRQAAGGPAAITPPRIEVTQEVSVRWRLSGPR